MWATAVIERIPVVDDREHGAAMKKQAAAQNEAAAKTIKLKPAAKKPAAKKPAAKKPARSPRPRQPHPRQRRQRRRRRKRPHQRRLRRRRKHARPSQKGQEEDRQEIRQEARQEVHAQKIREETGQEAHAEEEAEEEKEALTGRRRFAIDPPRICCDSFAANRGRAMWFRLIVFAVLLWRFSWRFPGVSGPRAGWADRLQVVEPRSRARACARRARLLPRARLPGGGRGGRPLRCHAGDAARSFRRPAHGADRDRQGLDRGLVPHQHGRACRADAGRHAAGRHPCAARRGGGRGRAHVEAGGSTVGGVGVSGAPGGEADEACAKAGIEAVQDKLEF